MLDQFCYRCAMRRVSESEAADLKGLKNLSWLSASQRRKLVDALSVSRLEKREIIFDEKNSSDVVHILLSGVARTTCRNRKGRRVQVMVLSPGMIPALPLPIAGIKYEFRCEAATSCQIGTIDLEKLLEICLGQISPIHFRRMAVNYVGRWDAVQLRCANFMKCTLAERLALTLLELGQDFGVDYLKGLRLAVPIRHKDLAELVGASRPRVTEHLKHFERMRMVAPKSRHLILNRDRLESFLLQTHAGYLDGRADSPGRARFTDSRDGD